MTDLVDLEERITSKTARVCVLGQGYVGLSLACGCAVAGLSVVGYDLDRARIAELSAGHNVVAGVEDGSLADAMASGLLRFTTDPSVIIDSDIVVICVPTPVIDHRPDMTHIESAAKVVAEHLRPGTLVILESTTYPGTTDDLVRPLIEAGGLTVDRDFLLAFSPERIDPGNLKYGLRNTPRVVGGTSSAATSAAVAFYALVVDDVHPVSSARAAEMAKLLENTFRMVNIALVNELATLCDEQDIDVWEVIGAAASKPFGFMPFYPGPGVGGHCIPLDPTYLAWQSRRDTGRAFRLVETAQDINADMPRYVTRRVIDALNDHGVAIRGARVLALGVTYKPDVGDLRESAALEVITRLARRGADVRFHDPFIERLRDDPIEASTRVPLDAEQIRAADLVLLLTPHSSYDLDWLISHSPLLFDARNATAARHQDNVVVL